MKKNSPQTWSDEEDRVLSRIILGLETLDSISWKDVATHIPGRRGKQCRERWYNHLRPNIRSGPWEEEEEANLISAHRIHGNKWAKISQCIDGRTGNNVKNHWFAQRRKIPQILKKNPSGDSLTTFQRYILTIGKVDKPDLVGIRSATGNVGEVVRTIETKKVRMKKDESAQVQNQDVRTAKRATRSHNAAFDRFLKMESSLQTGRVAVRSWPLETAESYTHQVLKTIGSDGSIQSDDLYSLTIRKRNSQWNNELQVGFDGPNITASSVMECRLNAAMAELLEKNVQQKIFVVMSPPSTESLGESSVCVIVASPHPYQAFEGFHVIAEVFMSDKFGHV